MAQAVTNLETIDDCLAAILRQKSPAEKVVMIAAAHRTAKLLAAAGIRYQHPDWTEEQVLVEAVRRISHPACSTNVAPAQ